MKYFNPFASENKTQKAENILRLANELNELFLSEEDSHGGNWQEKRKTDE